jgi:metal-sulfur cluster biosynthetic enzyme
MNIMNDQNSYGRTVVDERSDPGAGGAGDRVGRSAADLDQTAGAPGIGSPGVAAGAPAPAPAGAGDAVAGAPSAAPVSTSALSTLDDLEEALKDVVDPELGINVVDLGLVYDLQVGADNVATIDMTLTSAACPLQDMIEDQVSAALTGGPTPLVEDFRINWVWLPPWGPEKITDDGRDQLRALGFNI